MSDPRYFRDAESVCSSGPTHFPTLKSIVSSHCELLGRDQSQRPNTRNLSDIFGDVFWKLSCDGGINNIYADEFAARKTFCLHSLSIRVQNSGKPCHAREKRMIFVKDTIPTPRYLRRFSIRNSPSCAEGVYPRNFIVDRQTIQISDLHFYTFPTSSTFSCWKVRFKIEVCACS